MNRSLSSRVFAPLAAALLGALAGCSAEPVAPAEPAELAESFAVVSTANECQTAVAPASTTPRFVRAARPVPGQYLVVLRPWALMAHGERTAAAAAAMVKRAGGELVLTYEAAITGFAAKLSEEEALRLLNDPRVDYIEEDSLVSLAATQFQAPWGLDRVDQRTMPLNQQYTYNNTGAGVHLYILDTGVRVSHQEFTGRVGNSYDALSPGSPPQDCNGHGTAVASVAAGTHRGIAKGAIVHSVRVYDCTGDGPLSFIVAGVDWVTANHIDPAVANMSLRVNASPTLDAAVSNSINAGVTYVAAAGNCNLDACQNSPARVPGAITVAASAKSDQPLRDIQASFSNHGPCVDLYAPGVEIPVAGNLVDYDYPGARSGTSFAAPHVAGVAALHLQANPWANPALIHAQIVNQASLAICQPGPPTCVPPVNVTNRLLYTNL